MLHAASYEQVKLDEAQRKRGGGDPKVPEAGMLSVGLSSEDDRENHSRSLGNPHHMLFWALSEPKSWS